MSIWLACALTAIISGIVAFFLGKRISESEKVALQTQLSERIEENAELHGKLTALVESKQEIQDLFETSKADLQKDMEALGQNNLSLQTQLNEFKKIEASQNARYTEQIARWIGAIKRHFLGRASSHKFGYTE